MAMRGPIICSSVRSLTRESVRARNSRMVAINWRTPMVRRGAAVALEIIVGNLILTLFSQVAR